MPFIDHKTKTINFKIVYYGPGLAGKTTNILHIHSTTDPKARGKLINLATETDRALFFDFSPAQAPTVRGHNIRLHPYTVPG